MLIHVHQISAQKNPICTQVHITKKSKLLSDDRRTIFQITNFGTTISTRTSIRRKKNKKCTFRIKKSTIRKKLRELIQHKILEVTN